MRRLIIVSVLVAACGGDDKAEGPPMIVVPVVSEPQSIIDARDRYPRLFDLQVGLLEKTCSPNPNVCHNNNNYPDLRTAGNLLSVVNAPCNVEIPDPTLGWDSCERPADVLVAGDVRTRIAWIERRGPGTWRFGFEHEPQQTETVPFLVVSATEDVVLSPPMEWGVRIRFVAGVKDAEVVVAPMQAFLLEFVDSVVATVVGGDANKNGVYGAEGKMKSRGAMVMPGNLTDSYLWGRLTGTVPGTRMPLANDPLDNAAYAAIACWIEGLSTGQAPGAEDAIDYDNCQYAKNPLDPAL